MMKLSVVDKEYSRERQGQGGVNISKNQYDNVAVVYTYLVCSPIHKLISDDNMKSVESREFV